MSQTCFSICSLFFMFLFFFSFIISQSFSIQNNDKNNIDNDINQEPEANTPIVINGEFNQQLYFGHKFGDSEENEALNSESNKDDKKQNINEKGKDKFEKIHEYSKKINKRIAFGEEKNENDKNNNKNITNNEQKSVNDNENNKENIKEMDNGKSNDESNEEEEDIAKANEEEDENVQETDTKENDIDLDLYEIYDEFGIDGRHYTKKRLKPVCKYPNTIPGYGGKCICNHSYIGDDPIQERGCWKCNDTCHSQSKCVYPGVCVCDHGLVGDGIASCVQPDPNVISCKSSNIGIHSYPEVECTFEAIPNFIPYYGFCKFGAIVVQAKITSNTSMSCMIPNEVSLNSKTQTVRISFEGKTYSKEFEYEKQDPFKVKHWNRESETNQLKLVKSEKNYANETNDNKHYFLEIFIIILCSIGMFYAIFGKFTFDGIIQNIKGLKNKQGSGISKSAQIHEKVPFIVKKETNVKKREII